MGLAWVPLTPPVVHGVAAHVPVSLHTQPWLGCCPGQATSTRMHDYIMPVPSMRGCRIRQVRLPQCHGPRSNQ